MKFQVKTGYLGTICPFTRRIMAAGVDVQTVQKMSLTVKDTPIHGADSELSVEVNPQENSKTRYRYIAKPFKFIIYSIVYKFHKNANTK